MTRRRFLLGAITRAGVAEVTPVVEGQVVLNEPVTWGKIRALHR